MSNSATIPTRAWFGDPDIELDFPPGWQVTTIQPNDAPRIDKKGIEGAFANPIGTKRIAEMAVGKKSAAIIVDDLSRPTPVADLVPYVLRELRSAGVPEEEIRFVIGGGSHRPSTPDEIAKKIGAEVAASYQVTCHDCYSGDLCGIGNMPDGTPLYFNRVVAEADFKIALGGIFPHSAVGFGGGAKLVLPGVSGFATMFCFHRFYASRGHAVIERSEGPPDHRDAAEAAARVLGLDVIVNAVINGHRQIAGVFVGDFIKAQLVGARFAKETYSTKIPDDIRKKADVVVANAYPLDFDAIQTSKALWVRRFFVKAYTVAVNPASDGICYHGLFDQVDWVRYSEKLAKRKAMADPLPKIDDREQILVWSEHFPVQEFQSRIKGGVLYREWNQLIGQLRENVPPDATVAVFPCAGIQVHQD